MVMLLVLTREILEWFKLVKDGRQQQSRQWQKDGQRRVIIRENVGCGEPPRRHRCSTTTSPTFHVSKPFQYYGIRNWVSVFTTIFSVYIPTDISSSTHSKVRRRTQVRDASQHGLNDTVHDARLVPRLLVAGLVVNVKGEASLRRPHAHLPISGLRVAARW